MDTSIQASVTEKNKRPGIRYAVSDDGLELPVIDITHPAFAFNPGSEELAAIEAATLRGFKRSSRLPGFILRYMAKRSIIMRGTMRAAGGILSGTATYLQKLGPENLGRGYAGRIDRRMASSLGPASGRLRLQAMARLIADGLGSGLAGDKTCPIHMINIGGGAAADSYNALLLLQKEHPHWLEDRQVRIHVLDLDSAGPSFGRRALMALLADESPLAGLDACLDHVSYDWTDVTPLRAVLGKISRQAVVAGSSEGGLFEYGSDAEIVANLEVLRTDTSAGFFIVGSLIRDGTFSRAIKEMSRMTFVIRDLEEFRALVSCAGWAVNQAHQGNPLYHIVRLKKIGN